MSTLEKNLNCVSNLLIVLALPLVLGNFDF